MMKLIRNIYGIGLFFSFLLFQSCVDDLTQDIDDLSNGDHQQSWSFPLIQSEATIEDMSEDEDIETNAEGVIQFVMNKDSIFFVQADSIVQLAPQTPYQKVVSFADVTIPDFSTTGDVSFNQMFTAANTPQTDAILLLDGTVGLVPAFGPVSGGTYNAASVASFDWVSIDSGTLEVTVENTSDIPLTNVEIDIIGLQGGGVIGTLNFASIPAGGSATDNIDLSGKIIENDISFEMVSLSSTGSASAGLINLGDKLEFTIASSGISVIEGWADFDNPFFEDFFNFKIVDENGADLNSQLTKIRFKTGVLLYSITSQLSTTVLLNSDIPGAEDENGDPIEFSAALSAMGGPAVIQNFNLQGATIPLDQDPSEPYNNIRFRLDLGYFETPGNNIRYFNINETLTFNINLLNLNFEYVEGYFEQKTIPLDTNIFQWESDLFDKVSGDLYIDNPELTLTTRSSMGVDFGLDMDGTAFSVTGESKDLSLNQQAITFGPDIAQAGLTITSSFTYDKTNSNIDEVVPILPNEFKTWGEMTINPQGNSDLNFVFDTSKVEVLMELALPMEMTADTLHIRDRQKFDQDGYESLINLNDDEAIKSVFLLFEMENGFPFGADIFLVLIDSVDESTETIMDTILMPGLLEAAGVDENGKVNAPAFYNTTVELDSTQRGAMGRSNVSILAIDLVTTKEDDGSTPIVKVFEDDYIKSKVGVEVRTVFDVEQED